MRTEENFIIHYIDVCNLSSVTRREQQRIKFVYILFSSYTESFDFRDVFCNLNHYSLFDSQILPCLLGKLSVIDHILN